MEIASTLQNQPGAGGAVKEAGPAFFFGSIGATAIATGQIKFIIW